MIARSALRPSILVALGVLLGSGLAAAVVVLSRGEPTANRPVALPEISEGGMPTEPLQDLTIGNLAVKGPRPWVDVRAFGAIGDGTAVDVAAIQAAIDSIPTTGPGGVTGGTVVLPPGNYYLGTDQLVIDRSSISLWAMQGTALSYSGTDAAIKVDCSTYLEDVTIRLDHLNLNPHIGGVPAGPAPYGIRVTGDGGCSLLRIYFSKIDSFTVAGIRFEDGSKNVGVIDGDVIAGGQYGIQFIDGADGAYEAYDIRVGVIFNTTVAGFYAESQFLNSLVEVDVDLGSDATNQKIDIAGAHNTIILRGANPANFGQAAPTVRLRPTAMDNTIFLKPQLLTGLIDESPPGSNTIVAPATAENWIKNPSFESWSGEAQVDWSTTKAIVTKEESDVRNGRYSARLTSRGAYAHIFQRVPDWMKGQTVTLAGWMKAPSTNTYDAAIALDEDGLGVQTVVPKDGLWHFVVTSHTFAATAARANVRVYVNASENTDSDDKLLVDGLVLVLGNMPRLPIDNPQSALTATATWDPPSLEKGGVASTTVTVSGASVGDIAYASHDRIGANNVIISAHVQSAESVRVVLQNGSSADIDIPTGTLRVTVRKY